MKNMKAQLFIFGILAIVLAGCFNPTNALSPKQGDPASKPFMMDVVIGKDTEDARSVAGPKAERIKENIRNIVQLIVVDDKGSIVAFDEVRRGSDNEDKAKLRVETLLFNKKYHFLLLMGHWERNYGAETNGNYMYTKNPPTLLAAGLTAKTITGSGTVEIPMWPIVVDTVFTTTDTDVPGASRQVEAKVTDGKPSAVNLLPVDWNVIWTLKRGDTGTNGLTDLITAQNIGASTPNSTLQFKNRQAIVRKTGGTDSLKTLTIRDNAVTLSISGYTAGVKHIGTSGSVNFELEYVPLNKTGAGIWTAFKDKSKFDLSENKPPVWIIRNGVNDKAQDNVTDFEKFGNYKNVNGNGAVSFVIKADTPDPNNPTGGNLVIENGTFKGPGISCWPEVEFTTGGYTGNAELYYAVTKDGNAAPNYSTYKKVPNLVQPGRHSQELVLSTDGGNYDIYILIAKGGKVSAPLKINTTAGSTNIEPIWQ
jgi:PBP1b-binding outer membrane lipoprotein LpoB